MLRNDKLTSIEKVSLNHTLPINGKSKEANRLNQLMTEKIIKLSSTI